MDPTPAMCELGHTLDSCEQAYIEADPSFPAKVAKFYIEWIGLMAVLHRKLGIGQQTMEKEILDVISERRQSPTLPIPKWDLKIWQKEEIQFSMWKDRRL